MRDQMHVRHVIGLVLALLTVPVLVLGILDPIEGGVAMLVAGILLLATWLVSRIPVPRLEWIAWTATMALAVITDVIAGVLWSQGITGPGGTGVPWWLWILVGAYEIGVVITVTGGVWYLVRHARALRGGHREVPA